MFDYCEDLLNLVLWVDVSLMSELIFDELLVCLLNDFVLLFVLFFDWCDNGCVWLLFVLLVMVDLVMLCSVGVFVLWFGVLVDYWYVCFLVLVVLLVDD